MCTSEGTDNPPWGSGLSVLARRSLLNPPGDKPDTRVGEADLISHRKGDVQIASVHVRPTVDHRDIVGTPSCVAHRKLGAKRQSAVRRTPRRRRHYLPRGRVGSWHRVPRCIPGLGFCLMFGQPDGKQQRYQSAQHGQRQSSHMGTPPRSPLAQQLGRVAKMRSTLCAGSYTLRAIFRPWKPTGPNRYSLKGWILGPSRFSCPYSPECVEVDFSHLAAYHITSVRLSTKALGTFCGLLPETNPQKVPLQRTCSCWKVHSEKRDKGPQTLFNMVGRGQEPRSALLQNYGEGHIYPFCSQMAKVE